MQYQVMSTLPLKAHIPVLIRADNRQHVGIGHVMRCRTIARALLTKGQESVVLLSEPSDMLKNQLQSEGFRIETISGKAGSSTDASETVQRALSINASWIIIDGYCFNEAYLKTLNDTGIKQLIIDDSGKIEHGYFSMLLNPNPYAEKSLYPNPSSRFLVGSKYTLIRESFMDLQHYSRTISPKADNILVTMGGSDPQNILPRVIDALDSSESKSINIKIISGPSNPNQPFVHELAEESHHHVEVIPFSNNMAQIMVWADLAISAGGTTLWEMAFMGLPNLVITVADNQIPGAEYLKRLNASYYIGHYDCVDTDAISRSYKYLANSPEIRLKMSQNLKKIVDGQGAVRVAEAMDFPEVVLRLAESNDCRMIWHLSNQDEVRQASFSSDPIPWQSHRKWFLSKLNDPSCKFYIAESHKNEPVGQIRVDVSAHDALVSVSLFPEFRGKGLGAVLIDSATEKVFKKTDVTCIHAHIKENNNASIKAFERAGFSLLEKNVVNGHPSVHLVKHRASCYAEHY